MERTRCTIEEWRRDLAPTGLPVWLRAGLVGGISWAQPGSEPETQFLRRQAEALQEQLRAIQARLAELSEGVREAV